VYRDIGRGALRISGACPEPPRGADVPSTKMTLASALRTPLDSEPRDF
jgi:hypothetical protein